MTNDHAAAVGAAEHLYGEPWFLERTRQAVDQFGEALVAELAPGEELSLAAAVMVDRSGSHPGLLAVVRGSRFLLCWSEGPQPFRESYTLQSVPAETSTGTVAGIEGDADLLVLADRRIVLPSAAAAEQLRVTFTASGPPPAAGRDPAAAAGPSDAETQQLPPALGSGPATEPMRPVAAPPPRPAPPQAPARAAPAATAASSGGPSGRRALIIAAVAVAAVLLLGAAAFAIYRVTQRAAVPTPAASGSRSPGQATPTPSTASETTLPRSREPLPDDTMIVRRNDADDWRIETLRADGSAGAVLATGRENRALALTRDRRTVLYLRVAGDTTTLRAVAADGSTGRGLFSDTSACPRLAQPAINADNVLAMACGGALKLLDLDGKVVRVLDRGRVGDPTFTADGRAVVYWKAGSGDGDGGSLYRVPVNGSARPARIVSASEGVFDDPVCAPDGELVAVSRLLDGERQIVTLAWTGDGSDLTELTASGVPATGPGWSPGGDQIAYRIGTGNDSGLALVTADGTAMGEILPSQPYLATPVWTAH